jgi:hypothetical protein
MTSSLAPSLLPALRGDVAVEGFRGNPAEQIFAQRCYGVIRVVFLIEPPSEDNFLGIYPREGFGSPPFLPRALAACSPA